jgi:hypothetical protein
MAKTTKFIGVPCRDMPPTKNHYPVVWECLLGTVYGMRKIGGLYQSMYFDYDWYQAFRWAGVKDSEGKLFDGLDLRVSKIKRAVTYPGAKDSPRVNQLALWMLDMEKPKCRCREPRSHAGCSYCGHQYIGEVVCGICRENGIDGKLIPGTGRVVCKEHKTQPAKSPR